MKGDEELQTAKLALTRGDGPTAVAALNRLLRDRPDHPEGLYLMALCANAAGRVDVAVEALRKARKASPADPDIAYSLGSLLAASSPDAAGECLRDAVRLRPDFAAAWTNLGNLLAGKGLLEEAATAYERALAADPDLVEVETNLGVILQSQGRHDDALRRHDNVIRRRPDFRTGWHNRLMSMHYNERIAVDEVMSAHRDWGRAFVAEHLDGVRQSAGFANTRQAGRRLRVGYVSPDFRQHPVASFFLPLVDSHDRTQVEVWCYADVARPDPMTESIRARSDHWVDASGLDDAALMERIVSDRIDILVDLAGHTARNRLSVFARRAAPVQMTWLGYPGITGLPTIDWRLTDAVADPPCQESGQGGSGQGGSGQGGSGQGGGEDGGPERLARMPDGFLCYRPPVEVAVAKPPLVGRPPVFGSFNNFAKVNGTVLDHWSEILRRCPGAVLMLKARSLNDPGTRRQCADAFADRGIDPNRVRLRGTVPGLAAHFACYNEIDIALDTFPYNGTTTTFDALWMGTPVITLRGDRHAARVGASILTHLGLPELIAEDAETYVREAVSLATDLPRRDRYVSGLRDKMAASTLLDAARFARAMEKTYRDKWHYWVKATGLL